MRLPASPFWRGCLGAILGTGLVLLGYHVWADHRTFHVLVTLAVQGQARPTTPP